MDKNQLILGDSLEILKTFPDNSIDAIITDPPYGYLKHKLDAYFDADILFSEAYRVLIDKSFLTFFGRGTPFFKWNTICDELGFIFKEELVWDKKNPSNFLNALPRTHELAVIHSKGSAKLNKIYINKIEYDLLSNPKAIAYDLKRIVSTLKSIKSWDEFKRLFIDCDFTRMPTDKHFICRRSLFLYQEVGSRTYLAHLKGKIQNSIIRVKKEHYQYQHPTQKPLELIKRLVELTTKEGDTVLDPFVGSGTTAIACLELNRKYIVIEKEKEYYEIAKKRIEQWHNEKKDKQPNYELPENVEREIVTEDGQLKLF